MAFDIYGNRLERGHCEVHPHVHQEYPCSICMSEKRQSHAVHPSPDCGICGGPHGCADSNGYVVCSQGCSDRAEILPSANLLVEAYETQRADHAAFVERVREIAENMQHWETCDVLWREIPAMHNAEAYCTCVRGQLLEVLNG